MTKVWDKPITADTDWGGDASTNNLPVSGKQVQAWIKGNIKDDTQISQLITKWLNENTTKSTTFWKGLPINTYSLKWVDDKLTIISEGGTFDEEALKELIEKNTVTIEGEQEVKGRKDFVGGLAVNGQNIIYDKEKKVWQLVGDLLVTGAITMFGSTSGFTPSTIMDAVLYDDITIKRNSAGQLYVASGAGVDEELVKAIIADALKNYVLTDTFNTELAKKWTRNDTQITNWDSAFNWGDHSKAGYAKATDVATQLKQYILKDTVEQISARHNFTDGLQIAGVNIYKSKDKTIYLDANLVISGAFAMFGKNSTTFETIWKDIPFDDTMEWNGSTWSVVGGANNIDVTTVNGLIYEYLNRTGEEYAKQSWVNQQGFAKQSALTAVDNRLSAVEVFFATEDSDTLVNKWAEIVDFLNATEGDTLDSILSTKANKATTLAGYGITDAYTKAEINNTVSSLNSSIATKWTQDNSKIANWDSAYGWGNHASAGYAAKTYVDTELTKYVKLAVAQSIEAQHNFVNGLKIGGLPITKSASSANTIYLDANLVVSGAVTMFGSGSTTFPTIWANIPFDSTMQWDGSKWSVVGGGSGGLDTNAVNVLIYEYLTQNSYSTISDISSALTGYATQSWVGNNYLSKSGGTIATAHNAPLVVRNLLSGNAPVSIGLQKNETLPAYLVYYGDTTWAVSDPGWYHAYEIFHKGNYSDLLAGSIINGSITATSFIGNLTGNADSATNADMLDNLHSSAFARYYDGGYLDANEVPDGVYGGKLYDSPNWAQRYYSYLSIGDSIYKMQFNGRNNLLYYRAGDDDGLSNKPWREVAFTDSNVASATKLRTPRTIWGQPFDGTGDMTAPPSFPRYVNINRNADTGAIIDSSALGCEIETYSSYTAIKSYSSDGDNATSHLCLIKGGNVAIGGSTADAKLHVWGNAIFQSDTYPAIKLKGGIPEISQYFESLVTNEGWAIGIGVWGISGFGIGEYQNRQKCLLHLQNNGNLILNFEGVGNYTEGIRLNNHQGKDGSYSVVCFGCDPNAVSGTHSNQWTIGRNDSNHFFIRVSNNDVFSVATNGDTTINGKLLTTGAITMFSQLSMKNVMDYDGLSLVQLEQIQPARFTWKDGRDNRIHVGGIADHIQPILPEVVYETANKELTVDYGSAAFYIGTSLIKPVVELWKVKDKRQEEIESLKKRVKRLENENRQLRAS